ncbi:hypothetical protein OEZ86_004973 [Tetradesmus obliquus]|nr:hypothetical protein OEZ86_004973 [Tetradesmus obliquus]
MHSDFLPTALFKTCRDWHGRACTGSGSARNNANEAIVTFGSSATACAPVQQQQWEPVSPACFIALEALYSYSKTGCEPTAAAAPSGCVRQCAPQQQTSRTKYVRGAVPLSPTGRAGAVNGAGEVLLLLELCGVTPPQEGRQWSSLATAGKPPVTRAMVVSWYMLCVVILGGSGQPRLRRRPGWCADGHGH